MTWKHLGLCLIGSGLGVGAVLIPGAAAFLMPLATAIIGGALGHAQGAKDEAPK